MLFVLSGLPSDKCLRPSLGPPRPLNTTSSAQICRSCQHGKFQQDDPHQTYRDCRGHLIREKLEKQKAFVQRD